MALDRGTGQLKTLEKTKNSTKPESGVLKMRTKRKINKTAIAMTLAVSAIAGSFATVYAAEKYSFVIARGTTCQGGPQVWKSKAGSFAKATVKTASAPGYSTLYTIYNYDDVISFSRKIENLPDESKDIQYQYGATGKDFWVNIRGCDADGTAPNYSTVTGVWEPTK